MVPSKDSEWQDIEMHVQLNDPGQSNGTFELWINGEMEMSQDGLNWTGNYTDYGINVVEMYNTNNQAGVPGGDGEPGEKA